MKPEMIGGPHRLDAPHDDFSIAKFVGVEKWLLLHTRCTARPSQSPVLAPARELAIGGRRELRKPCMECGASIQLGTVIVTSVDGDLVHGIVADDGVGDVGGAGEKPWPGLARATRQGQTLPYAERTPGTGLHDAGLPLDCEGGGTHRGHSRLR